jgi:hypothetical protein
LRISSSTAKRCGNNERQQTILDLHMHLQMCMERPALLSKTVKAGTVSDTLQLGHASLIFKHDQRLRDAAGLAERSAPQETWGFPEEESFLDGAWFMLDSWNKRYAFAS